MECQSKGDVDDIPKNESAKKIVRLFEDEVEKKAEKVTNETEKKLTNEIPSIFFSKECFMTEIEVSSDMYQKIKDLDIFPEPSASI